jgi:hypothetical protein
MMMAHRACSWWRVALLALAGAACSGEDPPPPSYSPRVPFVPASSVMMRGSPCSGDDDCDSSFCDRGYCAKPGPMGYGAECDLSSEREIAGGRCPIYICVRNRCSSCVSDSECMAYRGSPHCRNFYEVYEPGKNEGHGLSCGEDIPRNRPPLIVPAAPTSFPKPPSYPP